MAAPASAIKLSLMQQKLSKSNQLLPASANFDFYRSLVSARLQCAATIKISDNHLLQTRRAVCLDHMGLNMGEIRG